MTTYYVKTGASAWDAYTYIDGANISNGPGGAGRRTTWYSATRARSAPSMRRGFHRIR